MRKLVAFTAVSAAALMASPASAQAIGGPRVEVLAGWDNTKVEIEDIDAIDNDLSDESFVYGIGGGFDFAFGPSMSAGIDLEVTETDARITETDQDLDEDDNLIGTRYDLKGGLDIYLGARATYYLSDMIRIYGKLGYTRWKTKVRVYDVDPNDGSVISTLFSDSDTIDGWRVGAGMHFTNGMFYAGPEYRYSSYEDDVKRHQIVAVAGIQFGPRPAPPPVIVDTPPPPPPVAPATQTCPDGSVILATDVCPAPPPPPPPPPGERG